MPQHMKHTAHDQREVYMAAGRGSAVVSLLLHLERDGPSPVVSWQRNDALRHTVVADIVVVDIAVAEQ
jgi:hypothetical protein